MGKQVTLRSITDDASIAHEVVFNDHAELVHRESSI